MPEESEDCLYLNVWVPAGDAPEGGFPVMFWLYGGNLQFGTAGLPMYSGEHIAANRGVIVVGTNYRTNGEGNQDCSRKTLTTSMRSIWLS
jgi:carboxylesterase type B